MHTTTRLVFLVAVSAPWVAQAATYHVRKDGHDTSCDGTANASVASAPACAFLTVQRGVDAAQPGDTVSVHAGDYSSATINSARSGSAGKRVTLAAAAGETVTIGRTSVKSGHDYLTLQGFRMTRSSGFGNGLVAVSGSYLEIKGNHIYSSSSADYSQSVALLFNSSSSHALVDGNTLDGTSAAGAQSGPSMYVPINIHGSHHTFSGNIIKNMVDCERVFETNGAHITISGNEIFNIFTSSKNGNGAHVDIFQNFFDTDGADYVIEKNYIHDIDGQLGNYESNGGTGAFVYRNNIFANITSALFIHTPHHHFHNNTFYRVGTVQAHPILEYGEGQSGGTNPGGAYDMEYKNNIFFACGNGSNSGWFNSLTATSTGDYNYVATATNGVKGGFSEPHGVNGGNPSFVAAYSSCITNACDFHLEAGSVLRDKGATLPGFSDDMDGQTRSAPWDIGADEFSVAAPPSAPTGLKVQ